MATNQQSNLNLNLPLLPPVENVPVRAYEEFVKIYSTIRTLALALDTYTGTELRSPELQQEYADDDPRRTVTVGTFSNFYAVAAVALTYGQIVGLNSSGQVVLASRGELGVLPIGFVLDTEVAVSGIANICYRGVIGVTGLTAGEFYCLGATAGTISAGGSQAVLGFALTDSEFYFFNYTTTAELISD